MAVINTNQARVQRHGRSRAVFLDKDGTLVEDVPFNVDPRKLKVYPEAASALRRLSRAGYKLIVVSNQPGVAHGYFDEAAVERIGSELAERLLSRQVRLDDFYYCPHHPDGRVGEQSAQCDCRKPQEGMLRRAAERHDLDLAESWMVGDILNDVEAGKRAGCRAVLVDRGNETEWVRGPLREPDFTVRNLEEAAEKILAAEHSSMREMP